MSLTFKTVIAVAQRGRQSILMVLVDADVIEAVFNALGGRQSGRTVGTTDGWSGMILSRWVPS